MGASLRAVTDLIMNVSICCCSSLFSSSFRSRSASSRNASSTAFRSRASSACRSSSGDISASSTLRLLEIALLIFSFTSFFIAVAAIGELGPVASDWAAHVRLPIPYSETLR